LSRPANCRKRNKTRSKEVPNHKPILRKGGGEREGGDKHESRICIEEKKEEKSKRRRRGYFSFPQAERGKKKKKRGKERCSQLSGGKEHSKRLRKACIVDEEGREKKKGGGRPLRSYVQGARVEKEATLLGTGRGKDREEEIHVGSCDKEKKAA